MTIEEINVEELAKQTKKLLINISNFLEKKLHKEALSDLNDLLGMFELLSKEDAAETIKQVLAIIKYKIDSAQLNNLKLNLDELKMCASHCERAFKLAEKFTLHEHSIELLILLSDLFYSQKVGFDKAFAYRLWAYQRINALPEIGGKWKNIQEKNILILNNIEQHQFSILMQPWWLRSLQESVVKLTAPNLNYNGAAQLLIDLEQQARAQQPFIDAFLECALEQLLPDLDNIASPLNKASLAINNGLIGAKKCSELEERFLQAIALRSAWRPYQHIKKIKAWLDAWDKNISKIVNNQRKKIIDEAGWGKINYQLLVYTNKKYELQMAPQTPLWLENRQKLNEIKNAALQEFTSITKNVEGKWSKAGEEEKQQLIDSMRKHQYTTAEKLADFLKKIFTAHCKRLGVPCCEYVWLLVGSFARYEATVYSDIESLLLLEQKNLQITTEEKLYFKIVFKSFRESIHELGETLLDDTISTKGLFFDGGIDVTEDDRVLTTPQNLAKNITIFDPREGLSSSLFRPLFSIGKQDLLVIYQKSLLPFLEQPSSPQSINLKEQFLLDITSQDDDDDGHLKKFDALINGKIKNCIIDVKKDYLAPLQYVLNDLSILYNVDLQKTQTYDIIDELVEKKIFTNEIGKQFKMYCTFLGYLREKCHHHYHANNSTINFLTSGSAKFSSSIQLSMTATEYGLMKELEMQFIPQIYRLFTKHFAPLWEKASSITETTVTKCLQLIQASQDQQTKESNYKNLWKNISMLCGVISLHPLTEALSRYQKLYQIFMQELKIPFINIEQEFLMPFLHRIALLEPDAYRAAYIERMLRQIPYRNGQRYGIEQKEQAWQKQLEELVVEEKIEEQIEKNILEKNKNSMEKNEQKEKLTNLPKMYLEGISSNKIILNRKFIEEIWDKKKMRLQEPFYQEGNHLVYAFSNGVFIKFYPEYAAVEQALYRLNELLFGDGITPSRLLKMTIKTSKKELTVPVIVSRKVTGNKFDEVLANQTSYQKIDKKQLYQVILFTMLINPEDAKSNNYGVKIVKNDKGEERYYVIGFDNDRAFIPPFIRKTENGILNVLNFDKLHLGVKNIFFCLDEMLLPIPNEVMAEFLLLDPTTLCYEWINFLQQQETALQKLFSKKLWQKVTNAYENYSFAAFFPQEWTKKFLQKKEKIPQKTKDMWLGLPWQKTFVKKLYKKITIMQDLFKKEILSKDKEYDELVPLELLLRLEPGLVTGKENVLGYRTLFNLDKNKQITTTPEKRFEKITDGEYIGKSSSMTGGQITQAIIENIPTEKELYNFEEYGCQSLSLELNEIVAEEKNVKRLLEKLTKKNKTNVDDLWSENCFDIFITQVLQQLDFASYEKTEQLMIIQKLKGEYKNTKKSMKKKFTPNYQELVFINCEVLTLTDLVILMQNSPSIGKIVIFNNQKLDDYLFKSILNNTVALRELSLDKLPKLQYFSYSSEKIVYSKLEYLSLTNLKEFKLLRLKSLKLREIIIKNCNLLQEIVLEAPNLKYLTLTQCGAFNKVTINSKNIRRIDFSDDLSLDVHEILNVIENQTHLKEITLDPKKAELIVDELMNSKELNAHDLYIIYILIKSNKEIEISKILFTIEKLCEALKYSNNSINDAIKTILIKIGAVVLAEQIPSIVEKFITIIVVNLENHLIKDAVQDILLNIGKKISSNKLQAFIQSLLTAITVFGSTNYNHNTSYAAKMVLIAIGKVLASDPNKMQEIVNKTVNLLQDDKIIFEIRKSATYALLEFYKSIPLVQAKVIMEKLIETLELVNDDENIRNAIKNTLVSAGIIISSDQDKLQLILAALYDLLKNKHENIRNDAAYILLELLASYKALSPKQICGIIENLYATLKSDSEDIRNTAKITLAKICEVLYLDSDIKVVVRKFIDIMAGNNEQNAIKGVIENALVNMGKIAPSDKLKVIAGTLLTALEDVSSEVRDITKKALIAIGKALASDPDKIEKLVNALCNALKSESTHVRDDAVYVLLELIKSKEVVSTKHMQIKLQEVISTKNMQIIVETLIAITADNNDNELNAMKNTAEEALINISKIASPLKTLVIIERLLTALEDVSSEVRDFTKKALITIGKVLAPNLDKITIIIDELCTALKSKSINIRNDAVYVLLELIKLKEVISTKHMQIIVERLSATLQDNNEDIRKTAKIALAKISELISADSEKVKILFIGLLDGLQDKNIEALKCAIYTLLELVNVDKVVGIEEMQIIIKTLIEVLANNSDDALGAAKSVLATIGKTLISDPNKLKIIFTKLYLALKDKSTNILDDAVYVLLELIKSDDANSAKYTQIIVETFIKIAEDKNESSNIRHDAIYVLLELIKWSKVISTKHMQIIVKTLIAITADNNGNELNAMKNTVEKALINISKVASDNEVQNIAETLVTMFEDNACKVNGLAKEVLIKIGKALASDPNKIEKLVNALCTSLKSESAHVRDDAVYVLLELIKLQEVISTKNMQIIVETLIAITADNNDNELNAMKNTAEEALINISKIASPIETLVIIKTLLTALEDVSSEVRDVTKKALIAIGKVFASNLDKITIIIDGLCTSLKSESTHVRDDAVYVLLELIKLKEVISTKHMQIIVETLIAITDDNNDNELNAIKNTVDEVLINISKIASPIETLVIIKTLLTALEDVSSEVDISGEVRDFTKKALITIGKVLAPNLDKITIIIDELCTALKSKSINIRNDAVYVLLELIKSENILSPKQTQIIVETLVNNKGYALYELKKYEEAIQCFDEAIKLNPKYAIAWNWKGSALHRLKKYDEAIQCFDEAIKLDPNYAAAWKNKGYALYELKKYEEAIQCYKEASKLDSGDFDAQFWNNKGSALYEFKKYDEAIQCYDEVIKLDPNYAAAWKNKGYALHELKKYDEAIQCYDEAIKLDSEDFDARFWNKEGSALYELKKYDEAIKCFDEAIKLDPKFAMAWTNKGSALGALKKYDEAIQCYDEAIKLNPKYAIAWNNKGSALHGLKKYDEAIQCFDEAIKLDPNYAAAWHNKGNALYELKKYDEAIKCFDEAIKLEPKYTIEWNNKGSALHELKKYDEAIKCFDEAIKLDPKYTIEWNNKVGLDDKNVEAFHCAIYTLLELMNEDKVISIEQMQIIVKTLLMEVQADNSDDALGALKSVIATIGKTLISDPNKLKIIFTKLYLALKDESTNILSDAVYVLLELIKSDDANSAKYTQIIVETFIKIAEDKNESSNIRNDAVNVLWELTVSDDVSSEVRDIAKKALIATGKALASDPDEIEELVNALCNALKSESAHVRDDAVYVLLELIKLQEVISTKNMQIIVETLIAITADNNDNELNAMKNTAEEALINISKIASPLETLVIIERLLTALEDVSSEVRDVTKKALIAIGKVFAPNLDKITIIIDGLCTSLKSESTHVCDDVVYVLLELIKSENVLSTKQIEIIIKTFIKIAVSNNESNEINNIAKNALINIYKISSDNIQIQSVIEEIFPLLKDSDNSVRDIAKNLLLETGKAIFFAQNAMKNIVIYNNNEITDLVICDKDSIKNPVTRFITWLINGLQDENLGVRECSFYVFEKLLEKSIKPYISSLEQMQFITEKLFAILGDANVNIRELAWNILVQAGKAVAVLSGGTMSFIGTLGKLLQTENNTSIKQLPFIAEKLIAELGERDWETREAAKNALVEIGKIIFPMQGKVKLVLEKLIRILVHKNIKAQIWAVYTLGEFGKLNLTISLEQITLMIKELDKTRKNSSKHIEIIAVSSLVGLGKKASSTPSITQPLIIKLCDALKAKKANIRVCAAYVLVEMARRNVSISAKQMRLIIESLFLEFASNNVNIRNATKNTLLNITTAILADINRITVFNVFIKKIINKLEDENTNIRESAIFTLATLIKQANIIPSKQLQFIVEKLAKMLGGAQTFTKKFLDPMEVLKKTLELSQVIQWNETIKNVANNTLINIGAIILSEQMQFFVAELIKVLKNNNLETRSAIENNKKNSNVCESIIYVLGYLIATENVPLEQVQNVIEQLFILLKTDNDNIKYAAENALVGISKAIYSDQGKMGMLVAGFIKVLKDNDKNASMLIAAVYALKELVKFWQIIPSDQIQQVMQESFKLCKLDDSVIKYAVENILLEMGKTIAADQEEITYFVAMIIGILEDGNGKNVNALISAIYVLGELVKLGRIAYDQMELVRKNLSALLENNDLNVSGAAHDVVIVMDKIIAIEEDKAKLLARCLCYACQKENSVDDKIFRQERKILFRKMEILHGQLNLDDAADEEFFECVDPLYLYFEQLRIFKQLLKSLKIIPPSKIVSIVKQLLTVLDSDAEVNYWSRLFEHPPGFLINHIIQEKHDDYVGFIHLSTTRLYYDKSFFDALREVDDPPCCSWKLSFMKHSFIRFFEHDYWYVRYAAESALVSIAKSLVTDKEKITVFIAELIEALKEKNKPPEFIASIVYVLGDLEKSHKVISSKQMKFINEQLFWLLAHKNTNVRDAVEKMLIEIGKNIFSDQEKIKALVTWLINAFKDESANTEVQVCVIHVLIDFLEELEGLVKILPLDAPGLIIDGLVALFNNDEDDAENIKKSAEHALISIGISLSSDLDKIKIFIIKLISILNDKNASEEICVSMISVLGTLGESGKIIPLEQVQFVIDKMLELFVDGGLRYAAKYAVIKIATAIAADPDKIKLLVTKLTEMLDEKEENATRISAAYVLGELEELGTVIPANKVKINDKHFVLIGNENNENTGNIITHGEIIGGSVERKKHTHGSMEQSIEKLLTAFASKEGEWNVPPPKPQELHKKIRVNLSINLDYKSSIEKKPLIKLSFFNNQTNGQVKLEEQLEDNLGLLAKLK